MTYIIDAAYNKIISEESLLIFKLINTYVRVNIVLKSLVFPLHSKCLSVLILSSPQPYNATNKILEICNSKHPWPKLRTKFQ